MNKLIMALALLLTPFFSQISVASDFLAPKTTSEKLIISDTFGNAFVGEVLKGPEYYCQQSLDRGLTNYGSVSHVDEISDNGLNGISFKCWYLTSTGGGPYGTLRGVSYEPVESKTCPPDGQPDYIYFVAGQGTEGDRCYKTNPALEQCPQGSYKYKLAGGCVPITCGDSGSVSTMWASGSTYNNTTGTYCDGSCAHSVSGSQNSDNYSGNIGITGVATGEICGQGGKEDRWHNEGNGDDCSSVDGFLSCPNGDNSTAPPDTTPTVDLESEEVTLQEITPLIPVEEVCVTGDPSCEIRNLKETIVTKGLEQKEIDLILHNKKIAADEKTSTKIIDGINDSSGRNLQGLEMLTTAIDGLKGEIGSGGGSNGDGFGDGDVTCVGDDCEGDIQTDIEPTAGLVGYWVSEYPDGLQGVMDDQLIDIKDSEFFKFLDQFNPSISGGFAPTYQMCFNIGSLGNFGCHSFNIDPRTFPAIRIFILVSAGFLCRRILFGG